MLNLAISKLFCKQSMALKFELYHIYNVAKLCNLLIEHSITKYTAAKCWT